MTKSPLQPGSALRRCRNMFKKLSILACAPLILAGCNATFTNLTPSVQSRSTNNLYQVEVALDSRQETMRWDTINPQIMVGNDYFPMRPTPLMTNRWEGLLPVPANVNLIHYRYKFDYKYNSFGAPRPDSALSPEYSLKITEE